MAQYRVKVTDDRTLELPDRLRSQLQPGDSYDVSVTPEAIVLHKTNRKLTLAELRQRVKALGPDPNQPSLEEIGEIVKDVRQQLSSNS